MSSQFEKFYRVMPSGVLDHKFWNGVFQNIDQRLLNVENKKASFESAEKQLIDVGLKRINNTIQPAAEKIQRMSELGFMIASSEDSLKPEIGTQLSITLIKGEQADVFAPSPFIALVRRSTPDAYAIGRLLHYDREATRIDVAIVSVRGDMGPHHDWDVAALAGTVMAMWDALTETRALHNDVASNSAAVRQDKSEVALNLGKTIVERQASEKARIGADTLLADFNRRYLGPLIKLPNDAPLGTLAFDISQIPNVMKQMTETGWMPTVTVSVGGSRIQTFIAQSDGETGPYKVDGGFNIGMVFVNGVMIFDQFGVILNEKDGSFTLKNGVRKGTQIVFNGFLKNDLIDIYTKQELKTILDELRIPVGLEGFVEDTLAPDGWLAANGNLYKISAYPDLAAWAGTRWGGDGKTTFGVPDRRGLFPRAWDNGRGIDKDRKLGTEQGDAIRNITASGFWWEVWEPPSDQLTGAVSLDTARGQKWFGPKGQVDYDNYVLSFDASLVVPTAAENRVKNYALLPIIKY